MQANAVRDRVPEETGISLRQAYIHSDWILIREMIREHRTAAVQRAMVLLDAHDEQNNRTIVFLPA